MCFIITPFNAVIYLLIVYGLLRYFKQNQHNDGLFKPTGPLSIFHHKPSWHEKAKFKLSLIKNPRDVLAHNSLSKVAITMPCITIHCAGHY